MRYEQPSMMLIRLDGKDIITLSIGDANYDPEIKPGEGQTNPWQS